jgi:hypothetical protein
MMSFLGNLFSGNQEKSADQQRYDELAAEVERWVVNEHQNMVHAGTIENGPLICYAYTKHTRRWACSMFCCDTDAVPAIDTSKMTRVQLSVSEAKDIGEAVALVRSYDHGTGEACLLLVNGFIEAILPRLKKHRKRPAKK